MSETFYIKKTAFDDNNFDLAQRETDSFIIGPGELNGPAGLARDSDLELYGFGSLKWGEGVDQNQYRLMESSACPAKEDGDFLAGGADGNTAFLVASHGIVPKSEEDLGIGNGITAPLIGQLWYNTSDVNLVVGGNTLYNYELSGWETVFKEVHDLFNTHAADNDVHLRDGQNDFLDGLILGGSPLSLQSHDVNQLIGISDVDGTVQDQIDLMVDSRGDTMTGTLEIQNQTPGNLESSYLIMKRNPDPTAPSAAIQFRDSSDVIRGFLAFQGTAPNERVYLERRSNVGGSEARLELEEDGNVSIFGGANIPTLDEHLTRRDYVHDIFATKFSPTFTGNPQAPTPATSDNDESIATTRFVKNQVSNNGKTLSSSSSSSTTVPTGITRMEVTITAGGGGGAAGGDGGNFTGANGATGQSSSITSPGNGTITVIGGIFGRGWQGGPPTDLRRKGAGYGVSHDGTIGTFPGNCCSGHGGHGGHSELGYAGIGLTTGDRGQSGLRGGGGAGGWGQDNAPGEGGGSGHLYHGFFAVSAGQTVSWVIGDGGDGGTNVSGSLRNGGHGGDGYIIIRWATS